MRQLYTTPRQKGFSLVEVMVGMIIGMLGIIIIMQVTSVFEARKRTTVGGDDAQNGGAIALYAIQKDLSQAGYSISSPNLVGTSLSTPFITINPYRPVIVNPAQLNPVTTVGTDSFLVTYGNSNSTAEGALINNPTATLPYQITDGTGTGIAGEGGKGFIVGEWVIPSQSGVTLTHSMFQVIGPTSANNVAVSGVPPALAYVANQINPPLLFNMGSAPTINAYAIINNTLRVCNYMQQDCANTPAAWMTLADGIVSMRAVCNGTTGLRVTLVTRSAQYDPNVVTTVTPSWNPGGVSAPVVANPIASWGADWDHYRYKTFETIIPIRNAIWSGVRGC